MSLVQAELQRSGFEEACGSGVVMTGGSSKMEGVVELAEEVFHMPVRLGEPQNIFGLADVVCNPIHATGVGLVMYGQRSGGQSVDEGKHGDVSEEGILDRMKSWFKKNF